MRPSKLERVLRALIVGHCARSGFALNAGRRLHLASGTPDTQYLFFSHHKTGTALNFQIASDMSSVLEMPLQEVLWMAVWEASSSLSGSPLNADETSAEHAQAEELLETVTLGCTGRTVLYEDMRAPLLDQLLKACPGTRAVHLVRRPSSVVASNYVYTRDLEPGVERATGFECAKQLRNNSLETGLNLVCDTYFSVYDRQMLEVHQMIQDKKLDNILEVRFEDFAAKYDNTTRAIFEHLLGSDNPLIDELVKKARQHDVNRMDQSLVAAMSHISKKTDKAQVAVEMTRLHASGNSCIKRLEEADKLMGYSDP